MNDSDTLRLTIALADRADRLAGAERLAAHAGAEALFALVDDPELHVLVPAPGFPQTLPGGRVWRPMLEACASAGLHHAKLPSASSKPLEDAIACAGPGAALVFVGAGTKPAIVEDACSILPALSSVWRAEQDVAVAMGALRAAQEGARHAHALAEALERTRADLEAKARSLDESRARAEHATRAKDEFMAVLGHELRNPLAPIVTALHLLRLQGKPSREHEIIERQVAHLMRLVDDLLDVSRITQGKIELRRERIELALVTARAVEMVSPLLEQRRQKLRVEVAACGLPVDADPQRLGQVVSNLLTNASRYSSPESRITLRAEREGDLIRLRVIDQGIGIEPAMLQDIFDAFVQERKTQEDSQQGLGLGLAIVRSLVELHGGTVRATSDGKGLGSEFVVELQASTVAPPPRDPHASGRAERLPLAPGSCARILAVDDNADALVLLADVLASLEYDVRTAPDGPSAVELAREFQPEIALLDLGLPVMDGYELAARLTALGGAAPPRLVAITGYGQDVDRARSRAAGFEAHLVKPVDLELLQRILAGLTEPQADSATETV